MGASVCTYLPVAVFVGDKQAAKIGIIAAKAAAGNDLHITAGETVQNHGLESFRRFQVEAVGNADFSAAEITFCQLVQQRFQRPLLASDFCERFQCTLVAGLANDPNAQNAYHFCKRYTAPAIFRKVIQ